VRFENVEDSDDALKAMLDANGGSRRVPTILEDGRITIGFGGGT
jgi:hypothetical protein